MRIYKNPCEQSSDAAQAQSAELITGQLRSRAASQPATMEVAAARDLLAPALLLLAGLTAVLYALLRRGSGLRLPPSPLALPFLGHLHLLAPLPHQALHRLAARHGPLLYLRLGSVPAVAACSPDAAREVLKTHEAAFLDRPKPAAVHRLTYGGQDFSFSAYGPYWRFMKRACVHELLAGRTLDRLRHVRSEEVARLVAALARSAAAGAGAAVDVDAALMGLTGDVVSRMVMSRRWTGDDVDTEEMRAVVAETAELTGTFNLQDYIVVFKHWDVQGLGKRVDAVHRKFDAMMERILSPDGEGRREAAAAARERAPGTCWTCSSTCTRTKPPRCGSPGITSRRSCWRSWTPSWARPGSPTSVPNLPYLQAVAKETLRLHPTGPLVVRRSLEPCKVSGYDVPGGATVFVNVWAIGRDPASWGPDPLAFRPERFLEGENAGMDVRGQHFHLLPFGSGRRICPGASLAMLVVQAALAAMVQCFEWAPVGGAPVDMEEGPGLTLPRKHPLFCTVKARFDPMPALAADEGAPAVAAGEE
ncbi:hypothetical protein PVAP13_4NG180900 [Panicum virgatum]|uniref:Uncharacterized protein n=1 Tax=Panicum virgatum TaxID=38727 RepID=A0A8T0T6B6_PANVG|nr:hypothetical protein PVAP13_4NG180900 [Panicum virgatum]